MAETEIHGIKVTNLCLARHTARSLYGTKHIPVFGKEDPIRLKIIRRAQMAGPQDLRAVHHMQKTNMANVTSWEMGVIWKESKRDT